MLAYEELKGAAGREIWFRPPRHDARKLFPHNPPRVRVQNHAYRLHNISLGGIAAVSNHAADGALEVGEVVPLMLQQSGLSIFEGQARVCRSESMVFGAKVAFSLVNSYVDFDKLLSRNVQAQIAAKDAYLNAERSQLVPKEYRIFVSDTLSILRSYRALLDENVALTGQFHHAFDEASAFEACEARLVQHWRSLWRTGNDIVGGIMNEREIREATKEFTELVLTPEMRAGAIWDRSYAKPLGYPGDFQIMNQVYDWEKVGSTVYEKLVHRLGLEVAECIGTRMEVVCEHIAETVRRQGMSRPARVLSLGSGPAREAEHFLAGPHFPAGHIEFTLVDQEDAALTYAVEKTYPHIVASRGRARVQCLNTSFTDILRINGGLENVPPQDLVYSVGLFDYLTDRRATMLLRKLYDMLAPGGLLIIGNMNDTPLSNLWPMEFITDWTLEYRNEAQMLAWAKDLPGTAHTETESTGRVRMLFVRKP
jgi:SAM-dependent methyltransferase